MARLEAPAYGGYKDVNEAWRTGVLDIVGGAATEATGVEGLAVPEEFREA